MGGVGEQLGLACTCSRDARRWLERATDDLARPLGARALAEMTGYYTLSASHGLLNITLRILLMNADAATALTARFKKAGGFAPFTTNKDAWLSINATTVNALQNAATTAAAPAAVDLVAALETLRSDPRWIALVDRRGVDFHRWWPQSIEGGLPQRNPWQHTPDGTARLSVGVTTGYIAPAPEPLVAEADDALDALANAIAIWELTVAQACRDLGVPLFRDQQ